MKKKIGSLQLKAAIMVVIGILILGKILFSVYDRYVLVKMLREQGIYEISFSYVQVDERIEAHYLICEPPNNNQDISKIVTSFLNAEQIIAQSRKRAMEIVTDLSNNRGETVPFIGMNLIFLSPSKDLDIGVFPNDIYDSKYKIGQHILLTVSVTFKEDGSYEIDYLWPRGSY